MHRLQKCDVSKSLEDPARGKFQNLIIACNAKQCRLQETETEDGKFDHYEEYKVVDGNNGDVKHPDKMGEKVLTVTCV